MSTDTKQKSLFDVEADYEETTEMPEEYNRYKLLDFNEGDEYKGKPVMGAPYTYTFEDKDTGETVKKSACKLFLVDDEEEEYLEINFNLKKEDEIQTNVRKGSVLYDFVASLREKESPGCMEGFNVFKKLNLKSIREVVNEWDSLTIKILERTGKFNFNSFHVVNAEHNIK